VTRILSALEQGDAHAADQLLPLVYQELRQLATQKLAQEKPGQTLQPTALVHEADVRLVGAGAAGRWDGRGHFFAAAAEAMRRILIENARRKQRHKRGGGRQQLFEDAGGPLDHLPGGDPGDDRGRHLPDAAHGPSGVKGVRLLAGVNAHPPQIILATRRV
jgi:hypothetical protein